MPRDVPRRVEAYPAIRVDQYGQAKIGGITGQACDRLPCCPKWISCKIDLFWLDGQGAQPEQDITGSIIVLLMCLLSMSIWIVSSACSLM